MKAFVVAGEPLASTYVREESLLRWRPREGSGVTTSFKPVALLMTPANADRAVDRASSRTAGMSQFVSDSETELRASVLLKMPSLLWTRIRFSSSPGDDTDKPVGPKASPGAVETLTAEVGQP